MPSTQAPPVAAEQHPPLHGWAELHEVVQTWALVSQALCTGQSAEALQPQLAPTQPLPARLVLQLTQVPWSAPQAAPVVPAAQTPPLQQPPLQG